jgi:hypothetical protein
MIFNASRCADLSTAALSAVPINDEPGQQLLSCKHFVRRAFKTKLCHELSTSCRATTGTR